MLVQSVRVRESRSGDTCARRGLQRFVSTTDRRGTGRRGLEFGPAASRSTREAIVRPQHQAPEGVGWGNDA